MAKKRELGERLVEKLELPADVLRGVPRVTIIGAKSVLIENHRGLLEYGEELIEINGGALRLRVYGTELELESMTRADISVKGLLSSVEFE